jgi:hypothetical protein
MAFARVYQASKQRPLTIPHVDARDVEKVRPLLGTSSKFVVSQKLTRTGSPRPAGTVQGAHKGRDPACRDESHCQPCSIVVFTTLHLMCFYRGLC